MKKDDELYSTIDDAHTVLRECYRLLGTAVDPPSTRTLKQVRLRLYETMQTLLCVLHDYND